MRQLIQFIFCLFILVRLVRANLPSNQPKSSGKQSFAIEPVDATARLGETIILPCRVTNRVGRLQWTRDGFGLGLDRALTGFPRYQMVGVEEEGDYSLEISNVQLEDDAQFQCQVGASANVAGIRSRSSKLTVFIPPEPVRIREGEYLDTVEGKPVTLNCESNGGKPAAELSWLEENGRQVGEGVETSKQELADGKRFNSLAKWQFIAGKQHHNRRFVCKAENSALEEAQKATILIRVRFAPKVKIGYSGDQAAGVEMSAVQEGSDGSDLVEMGNKDREEDLNETIMTQVGENVTLTCDAIANPSTGLVYKWYRNDAIYPGDHSGTTLNIPAIGEELNDVRIGCEVINSIGSSDVQYRRLSVSSSPKFANSLAPQYSVNEGANLKLTCEVKSNPPAEIVWHHSAPQSGRSVVGRGRQLQMTSMDYSKAGRYTCVANAKGEEIKQSTEVLIRGAPRVVSSPNQYGLEGKQITLECIVQSVPKAKVLWRRNNQTIEAENQYGVELIEPKPADSDAMARHLLKIHNAKLIDFGLYNCTATNELGEHSILISLTRQKTFPTLMVIASVVGASAAFLCIGVVVLLVMRRSSKTGDDFSASLKKQAAGTNSSMVLTNSNNTNSNFNKALTDSGRSHLTTVDASSSAANSDLKLEIRTNSSLSDQEHHNPAINWDDELLMNNHTLLAAQNLYNGQHVAAFETANHTNYDTQQPYSQRFIITSNGVAPNYESIYSHYPPMTAMALSQPMMQNAGNLQNGSNLMNNGNLHANNLTNNLTSNNNTLSSKHSPAKQQQSPPTYHNLANLSSNLSGSLYLPSYADYGQLIDYMQIQTTTGQPTGTTDTMDGHLTSQALSNQALTNQALSNQALGYAISGQSIAPHLPPKPALQCESAYSTLQTDRYRVPQCSTGTYATARSAYSNAHQLSINQPGLPASPLYSNNGAAGQAASLSPLNSAIQVPNASNLNSNNSSSNLRNYITNNAVVNSLSSVSSQATLATHV